MKHFIKTHEELLLGILGLALAVLVISISVWVVSGISSNLSQAVVAGGGAGTKIYFKIDELKSINLRGLTPVSK